MTRVLPRAGLTIKRRADGAAYTYDIARCACSSCARTLSEEIAARAQVDVQRPSALGGLVRLAHTNTAVDLSPTAFCVCICSTSSICICISSSSTRRLYLFAIVGQGHEVPGRRACAGGGRWLAHQNDTRRNPQAASFVVMLMILARKVLLLVRHPRVPSFALLTSKDRPYLPALHRPISVRLPPLVSSSTL
jgi:hypothetical protein